MYIMVMKENFFNVDNAELERMNADAEAAMAAKRRNENLACATVILDDTILPPISEIFEGIGSLLH